MKKWKKLFLKISQYLQENTRVGDVFNKIAAFLYFLITPKNVRRIHLEVFCKNGDQACSSS